MTDYGFDTSTLVKNYQSEVGTPRVEQILREPNARFSISRLTHLELQAVLAGKVRTAVIGKRQLRRIRGKFLADVARGVLDVIKFTERHFQEAERLLRTYATQRSLRTLDALPLAVALDLKRRGRLDYFVCADATLCAVAQSEGLKVIKPEIP